MSHQQPNNSHHLTQQQQRDLAFETSFQSELYHIQKSLSPAEVQASRIVHSHSLEPLGSRLNNILLRPLALFCAGLFAMIAALFMTVIATNDGFRANYTIVIIAVAIGWLVGNFIDVASKSKQ